MNDKIDVNRVSPKNMLHIWISFVWRFIVASIVLTMIPSSVFILISKSGVLSKTAHYFQFIFNTLMILLASYYALREAIISNLIKVVGPESAPRRR
jgi:hypothetical protein